MSWSERLADETTHHYAELRQRRMPFVVACVLTFNFHRYLVRAVLFDDQFEEVVGRVLEPVKDEASDS